MPNGEPDYVLTRNATNNSGVAWKTETIEQKLDRIIALLEQMQYMRSPQVYPQPIPPTIYPPSPYPHFPYVTYSKSTNTHQLVPRTDMPIFEKKTVASDLP